MSETHPLTGDEIMFMLDQLSGAAETPNDFKITSQPRSLFYTLPLSVFSDCSPNCQTETTGNTPVQMDDATSPMIDLFNIESPIWQGELTLRTDTNPKSPGLCYPVEQLGALEQKDLLSFLANCPSTDLDHIANEMVGNLSNELFTKVLDEMIDQQLRQPGEPGRLIILALLVAKLSHPKEVLRDDFNFVLSVCFADANIEKNVLPDIWDVFGFLVSQRRLTNASTTRFFIEHLTEHLESKAGDVGKLIDVLTKGVRGWTEQVVEFLCCLIKTVTNDDKNAKPGRPVQTYINDFDLKKLTSALLDVSNDNRTLAMGHSYFNLLTSLVRSFPSFYQKNTDFIEIINQLSASCKRGASSNLSSLSYRRLLTAANSVRQ